MTKAIYVNLVVQDLSRSRAFFKALGMHFNPAFSNEQAAALVIGDGIYAMLHTPDSMRRFTAKSLADPGRSLEVMLALQQEHRAAVDNMFHRAIDAGGMEQRPAEDHGFMYSRSFEDPDGHIWEVFWMDSCPPCDR
ncbi:VOC family protein [Shewanella cyperi]|uniref:VOC family protein n=1 Tax=Shewanella cyperi TaxID=2814292 RepID=A0A975AM02_9GAMM|nr:VOC family protein [Shewanella cyperi]QSX30947.1 VOC family protein [Shewanella cyperi]QSX42552.1 VOC family protein [Shewanella cyperi]